MEHYKQVLKNDFNNRQRKNAAFSIRAYSKYLGVSQSTLSEVLRDRRKLPQKYAESIADKLELPPLERSEFITSVISQKKSLRELSSLKTEAFDGKTLTDQRDYNIIAHWEYYALLNLIETHDFQNDNEWISKRLGITVAKVEQVKFELERSGFIEAQDQTLVRKESNLNTTRDIFFKALRKSHRESLSMAIEKIENVDIDKRFYSSSTVPVSVDKIDEAKDLIREFREKLCTLLKEGKKEEVYNLNIQLYPLTNTNDN